MMHFRRSFEAEMIAAPGTFLLNGILALRTICSLMLTGVPSSALMSSEAAGTGSVSLPAPPPFQTLKKPPPPPAQLYQKHSTNQLVPAGVASKCTIRMAVVLQ